MTPTRAATEMPAFLTAAVAKSEAKDVRAAALPCLAEAAEDLRSSPFRGMRVFSRSMAWSSHTQACIFLHKTIVMRKICYFKTTNNMNKLILKKFL
jgi:hypothetical protein